MKHLSHKPFIFTFTLLLTTLLLFSDAVYAGRGGGRSGGGRSSGGARTTSVQRSSGSRGGGASPRVNSSRSLQNQGNFSNSRQQNQGSRQNTRNESQGNRQQNQGDRQTNRQQNQGDRQDNRQDFVNDNWRGGGWYGGGYYAPPGWGAWTAAVGFTTGVLLGASVATPPPYYETVYVGSTSYIYSDGVYLQPSNDAYVVISPPLGAVVTYLPDGCNLLQEGNVQYYECAGIYYETFYQNGTTVYKVVQY